MNELEDIYKKSSSGKDYTKRYLDLLSDIISKIDTSSVDKVIKLFLKCREDGKTIFIIGNGGSAATSSHFSEDLSLGAYDKNKRPFRTISLTDNASYITALGNDEGYENVFVGQLRCLLNKGDMVVSISGSGNSPNLLEAIDYANENGAITVGLVGFDGGKMKDKCKHCIHVKTKKGLYAPVEDIHLILAHIISTYLMYI